MTGQSQIVTPSLKVENIFKLNQADLNDICDATEAAIEDGGGFGWVNVPPRDTLERYWQGVITIPSRFLYVSRLDGVISGTAIVTHPPANNEARSHAAKINDVFTAPWARSYGLSRLLLEKIEKDLVKDGFKVVNLDVNEKMTAAINMFESMGYKRIGTHPYYAEIDCEIVKGHYYTKWLDCGLPAPE
jgi:ribosomal protein S18 acetylase RimI-like enzyme